MPYQVPQHIADNKIFLTNFSEVQGGRLDPVYVYSIKHKRTYNYASKSLNKLVSFATGGTPSKANPEYWDGNIFWVSAKDFKSFYIDSSEDTITELGLRKSSSKLIPQNSLLMVVRSGILLHTLPIAITKCPVAINQDIKALFVKDSQLNAQYLGYFFDVFNKYVLSKIVKHSTTVQSVNTNELERLEIPLPSLEIQKEIVSHMDAAYAQKQQKEQQAESLLQSIDDYLLGELGIPLPETKSQTIQDRMFVVNFSEVSGGRLDPIFFAADIKKYTHCTYSESISSLTLSCNSGFAVGRQDQVNQTNGILQIRPTNIDNNGQLKYDKNVYVPPQTGSQFVPDGVVLFNNTNSQEWVGKTAYFSNDEKRDVYISNHITAISVDKSKILPIYLSEILNMYQRHKVFYSICTNWNNQSGIGLDLLSILHIPLFTDNRQISLSKQQKIVDHISSIRQQAKALQEEGRNILEQAKKEVERMILG